ncbi:MAG: phosphodiester glycosidase family protein [Deinococcota bacterium]|jgi:hypothetical protein|nr:phosphodiester glycosidase family protein [Deinococcota bacterium]
MKLSLRLYLLLGFALFGVAGAQDRLYLVPPSMVTESPAALQIQHGDTHIAYIDGLGWLPYGPDIPPLREGGQVYVSELVLEALAPSLPRLTGVRIGETSSVRVVLDLAGALGGEALEGVRQEGRLEDQGLASIPLPDLLVPSDLGGRIMGGDSVDVVLDSRGDGLRLLVAGSGLVYQAFPLAEPSRVVVDLDFLRFADVQEETRQVRPGVSYRRFTAPTSLGSSGVHLVEIAPGYGHFRVVGETALARPLSQLAGGSLAAVNAGFFDTRTAAAIGLLRVDHSTRSLPFPGRAGAAAYLGRATIGFGGGAPTIERVRSDMTLRVGARGYALSQLSARGEVHVHSQVGQQVGQEAGRALVVADGRVSDNGYGARTVPPGGFVVSYDPGVVELSAVRTGVRASLEASFSPAAFGSLPYAVEAGPLLLQGGRPAYAPDSEDFIGDMLTKRTDRSAIGVRPDGTVLLVTADGMTARELVPLFLSLGAERAMNLDGGGSTTLFLDGEVVNRRFERPIVSAIVWTPHLPSSR